MGKLQPQHRYMKIDGTSTSEPPKMPPGEKPQSLTDKFASAVSKTYRTVTCQSLLRAFNDLQTNPKITNDQGTPHTVQLMMAFRHIEAKVTKLASAIEAGGVAGLKAAREAEQMVVRGLENLVIKQSLNPL